MTQQLTANDLTKEDALSSYRFIQAMIGAVALFLPLATLWWVWWINGEHLDSISMTYHSRTRDLFVGCLCTLGLAFMSYGRRGRLSLKAKPKTEFKVDGWLAVVAGASAIAVALFPTTQCETEGYEQSCPGYDKPEMIFSTVHAVFTGILMLTMAVFCLHRFVRSPSSAGTKEPSLFKRPLGLRHTAPKDDLSKKRQNRVYRTAGGVIVASIAYIAVVNIFALAHPRDLKPKVGVPETLAVWAFGLAWLTKSGYYAWFYWLLRAARNLLPSHPPREGVPGSTPPPVPLD